MTLRQVKLDLNHLNTDINFFNFHLNYVNIGTTKERESEREERTYPSHMKTCTFTVQNVIVYNSFKFQLSDFTDTLNTVTCTE